MTVAPQHQHRGAGTLLSKWGVDLADNIGAEVCYCPRPRTFNLYQILWS